jgi:hypothetical protein
MPTTPSGIGGRLVRRLLGEQGLVGGEIGDPEPSKQGRDRSTGRPPIPLGVVGIEHRLEPALVDGSRSVSGRVSEHRGERVVGPPPPLAKIEQPRERPDPLAERFERSRPARVIEGRQPVRSVVLDGLPREVIGDETPVRGPRVLFGDDGPGCLGG